MGHGAGLDPVLAVVISRFIPEEEKGPFSKVNPLLCVIAFIVKINMKIGQDVLDNQYYRKK